MAAIVTETLSEFKARALAVANRPSRGDENDAFVAGDIDSAYEAATQQCGFQFPASSDTAAVWSVKQKGLWNRVRFFISELLQMDYLFSFDIEKARGSQIAKAIERLQERLKAEWETMRLDHAEVFMASTEFFPNDMVVKTGFYQDRYGEDDAYKEETSTTRTKSPEATDVTLDATAT